MLAREDTWRPGTPRVRSYVAPETGAWARSDNARGGRSTRGAYGGHAQGGGRGMMWREREVPASESSGSRKRNSQEAGVGRSQGGDKSEEEETRDTASSPAKANLALVTKVPYLRVQKKLTLDGTEWVPPPRPTYVPPQERKRTKKDGGRMETEVATEIVLGAPVRSTARSNELFKLELSRSWQSRDSEGTSRISEEICPIHAVRSRDSGP